MPETLDRSQQKFLRGDMVKLADEFPSDMEHFVGRRELAIVVGSYDDLYPTMRSGDRDHFSLLFPTIEGRPYGGTVSWYPEELMTMVKERYRERLDVLDLADKAAAARPPEPVRAGTRWGVPTTSAADDPKALYVRCMYHTFWWGPFADEDAVVAALKTLDAAQPMWDYDCFAIHYGVANMKDALNDPVYLSGSDRERIEARRLEP